MKIKELIPFLEQNKNDIKVHCATGSNDLFAPKKAFLNGNFKEWQEYQTQKNFERKYILSLIFWNKDEKEFRASYLCMENQIDKIDLLEITREVAKVEFPGYDRVNISWQELSEVIDTVAWKTALENQKAVYLIVDSSNGKKYVGSAYGEKMLHGRWTDYIQSGHGGNVDLKTLSFEHIKDNFRYSILEIFKSTTNDETILERETWWKEVLLTRGEFGYNKN